MRRTGRRKLPNWAIGLIMIVVLAVASYVAFTKQVPWGGGTEVQVRFDSAQNLRVNSPVRIAGVEVGKVTGVEPLAKTESEGTDEDEAASGSVETGAVVTMELDEDALPLKEDATFALKPRLFLEGNLFVDVRPGSPSSPEIDYDEHVYSASQTTNYVQLDEIFSGSFQADARKDLQILLDQFGTALVDEGGAKSLQELNRAAPGAFLYTSQVNEALLGRNPHDLSELIRNLDRVISGLGANEGDLQDLVTNLRITTGSFAAQSAPLEQAIIELPNTLDAGNRAFVSLNRAFPPMRAFAREALPGVETTPETLDAATPLLRQLRGLAQPAELRGLVADLRPTVPSLAELTKDTIPFLRQSRALSSCFNNVIIPWANDEVDGGPVYNADHGPQGSVFQETAYGLAGIAGESRSGDANGQYIRVIGGGGTNTVVIDDMSTGETLAGITPFPIDGAMPPLDSSKKTPMTDEFACETQEPPDLRSVTDGLGPAPEQDTFSGDPVPTDGEAAEIFADAETALTGLAEAAQAEQDGDEDAREMEAEALEDLGDFYEEHGG